MRFHCRKEAIDVHFLKTEYTRLLHVDSKIYKKKIQFYPLAFAFFIASLTFQQVQAQDPSGLCTPGTTFLNVDVSNSLNSTWTTPSSLKPEGQCCGSPGNHKCFEMRLVINGEANGVSINFTTPTGSVYYTVNCGPPIDAGNSNTINICFDKGDTGPHVITFCRSGTPSYEFTVSNLVKPFEVTLPDFAPVCAGTPGFLLSGGSPVGGAYYVNGVAIPFFDVPNLGAGDHEITYVYTDPASGCTNFAVKYIKIAALPVITLTPQAACKNEGLVNLTGASPPGGTFSGPFVSNNQFNTSTAIPGVYPLTYTYVNQYGCSSQLQTTFTVNPLPVANAGTDQTIAIGSTASLSAASGGTGTYSYSWTPANMLDNATIQNPTTIPLEATMLYQLGVTNTVTGCKATDQVAVVVTGEYIKILYSVAESDTICVGDSSTITVIPSGGVSGKFSYYWTSDNPLEPGFPSTNPVLTVSPGTTTTYTVVVSDPDYPHLKSTTEKITITVLPLPEVTISMPASVCISEPVFQLSGGLPAGGTYYLLDASGNVLSFPHIDYSGFAPAAIGAGSYQVMYEYTDPVSKCTSAAFQDLTINPAVTLPDYTPVCEGSAGFTLSGGLPAGGEYFVNGNPASFFDVPTLGPGEHEITYVYTYPSSGSCSVTKKITILPLPDITLTPMAACKDAGLVNLTGASPLGGNFSGPFISNNRFNTTAAAAGTYPVTYTYTGANGCSVQVETTFTVNPLPFADAGIDQIIILGETASLSAADGGTGFFSYSWTPADMLDNANVQNPTTVPITSTQLYQMVVTNTETGCKASDQVTVVVTGGDISLYVVSELNPICIGGSTLLSVVPGGGSGQFDYTWTSDNPAETSFPSTPTIVVSPETTTIYTVEVRDTIYPLTAPVQAHITVIVNPLPVLDFPELTSICANESTFPLTATPAGGDFYLVHADGNIFNIQLDGSSGILPNNTVAGNYQVMYEYTDPDTGCSNTAFQDLVINPVVTLSDFLPVCEGSPGFNLTGGLPLGGKYYLEGTEISFFDVPNLQPGEHLITYTLNGCSATKTISIIALPEITLTPLAACKNSGLINLSGAVPTGGVFTGDFITNNRFNTTTAPLGTHNVTYTYVNEYGCSSTLETTFTVNPLPLADAGVDQLIEIHRSTSLLAGDGGSETYSYSWTPANKLVNALVQNPTTTSLTESTLYTLQVTNAVTGCRATDQVAVNVTTAVIKVAYALSEPDTICFGGSTTITIIPGGGVSGEFNYAWTTSDPDVPTLPPTAIQYLSPEQTTTYTVVVSDAKYPQLTPVVEHITITVLPLPVVTISMPTSVCANEPNFKLSGGLPEGGTYHLLDMSGNVLNLPYINFNNFLPNNIGAGNYQVLYEYTDPVSKCTNTAIQPLTILPYVKAQFYASRPDLCSSEEVFIANHSIGLGTYEWNFGDGGTGSATESVNNPTFTYVYNQVTDITSYDITLKITNNEGCSDSIMRKVKIYPQIVSDFATSPISGCSPLEVSLTSGATGSILYHFWEFGDGTFSMETNSIHVFKNNTDSIVTFPVRLFVQSTNPFCSSSLIKDVVVYPYIEAGFTTTPVSGCHNSEVVFGNTSVGATTYFWDFGNGNTSSLAAPPPQFFVNTTTGIIEYTIKQIVSNGNCSDTITQVIKVYPEIKAQITASAIEGCSPLAVDFINLSSASANHYQWTFDDGGSASTRDASHIFENNTSSTIVYTVWMKARTGEFCSDSVSIDITVHPYLKADFDFTSAQGCNPHEVTIINKAYGASAFEWSIDDVAVYNYSDASFTHVFEHDLTETKVYDIKLVVTNAQGCSDSLVRQITIFPKIHSAFTADVIQGCTPLEVTFTNHSTGSKLHRWEFGDGGSSTTASPVHIFENTSYTTTKEFVVWLYSESENLCRDSISTIISVHPAVVADFTVPDNKGCSPFVTTLKNYSLGASTLTWDYGDLSGGQDMDEEHQHIFGNLGNETRVFTVELTAANEYCSSTVSREVTIYPEVQVSYTHIVEGCHPLEVAFINSTGNASYYDWNFSGGITSSKQNPVHTFHNFSHIDTVSYSISLYASSVYGCFATADSKIVVHPKPLSSFTATNSPGCSPYEITIEHSSEGALEYEWDFGDGSGTFGYSSQLVTHLYNQPPGSSAATYPISLITRNSSGGIFTNTDFTCSDTLVQSVVIYPAIQASIQANVTEGCHPLQVEFSNLTSGAATSGGNPATGAYFWDYGNGNTSQNNLALHQHTFLNHSHTRDTLYVVVMKATNNNSCTHSDTIQIRVKPQPKAKFSVPNNPACSPFVASIQNLSMGADNYQWIMGDGDTLSTGAEEFSHTYYRAPQLSPAQYTLQLKVETTYGCSDSLTQQILVYPQVTAEFTTQNQGCHPHNASFTNTSDGATLYSWDFGNGVTSQAVNPGQTFVNYSNTQQEIYEVILRTESVYGCKAEYREQITVNPIPRAQFKVAPFSGCSPFSPSITNLSTGATYYQWVMGDGQVIESDGPVSHTWYNTTDEPLYYPITLRVASEYGCGSTISQIISVYPEVTAGFTTENGSFEGCSPLTLKFQDESTLGDFYQWDFSTGRQSTSASPLNNFINNDINPATFTVQQVVSSFYGCRDTISREVTVFPSPVADFGVTPITQAYPLSTITLTNKTNPGFWHFNWEYGDGNNSSTSSFDPHSHTYVWDENDMSTRQYVIALKVNNDYCTDIHTETVTITSPIPKASISSVTSGCEPFTVQFSNQSIYAHTYHWDFGDGGYSSHPTPSHLFLEAGDYEVMMVAIGDGGRDSIRHLVEVLENPQAAFNLHSPHVSIPEEPLRVSNLSVLGDAYYWDFGDGNVSYEFEPEHYYTTPGIYDIQLVVLRHSQPVCSDTLRLKNAVRVDETCKIVFPDAFMPDINGPNGGIYDINNPSTTVFHPVHEGVENYVLEIFNRWGEIVFRSTDIQIGWDGYYRGRLAQMDVYAWKVTGRCSNGKSIHMGGNVTLYR